MSQNGDRDHRFFYPHNAAAVLGQGDARAAHLTGTGFTAQLGDQFKHLRETRGANGVSFALQPARRIDRQSSADR